jgi:hypothetical protein
VAGARCTLLKTQYRMHPAIGCFPNSRFYGGQLEDGPPVLARPTVIGNSHSPVCSPRDLLRVHSGDVQFNLSPYRFLDVRWSSEENGDGGSTRNHLEARVVASVVSGLVKALTYGVPVKGPDGKVTLQRFELGASGDIDEEEEERRPFSVGVITPYSAQKTLICHLLSKRGVPEDACEVDTVDGFQGREMDAIVLSTVRSSRGGGSGPGETIGFVSDKRRMNVALTRARHCLLIVGDSETLAARSEDWRELIVDAKARNCFEQIEKDGKSPGKPQRPKQDRGGPGDRSSGGGDSGGGSGKGGAKRKLDMGGTRGRENEEGEGKRRKLGGGGGVRGTQAALGGAEDVSSQGGEGGKGNDTGFRAKKAGTGGSAAGSRKKQAAEKTSQREDSAVRETSSGPAGGREKEGSDELTVEIDSVKKSDPKKVQKGQGGAPAAENAAITPSSGEKTGLEGVKGDKKKPKEADRAAPESGSLPPPGAKEKKPVDDKDPDSSSESESNGELPEGGGELPQQPRKKGGNTKSERSKKSTSEDRISAGKAAESPSPLQPIGLNKLSAAGVKKKKGNKALPEGTPAKAVRETEAREDGRIRNEALEVEPKRTKGKSGKKERQSAEAADESRQGPVQEESKVRKKGRKGKKEGSQKVDAPMTEAAESLPVFHAKTTECDKVLEEKHGVDQGKKELRKGSSSADMEPAGADPPKKKKQKKEIGGGEGATARQVAETSQKDGSKGGLKKETVNVKGPVLTLSSPVSAVPTPPAVVQLGAQKKGGKLPELDEPAGGKVSKQKRKRGSDAGTVADVAAAYEGRPKKQRNEEEGQSAVKGAAPQQTEGKPQRGLPAGGGGANAEAGVQSAETRKGGDSPEAGSGKVSKKKVKKEAAGALMDRKPATNGPAEASGLLQGAKEACAIGGDGLQLKASVKESAEGPVPKDVGRNQQGPKPRSILKRTSSVSKKGWRVGRKVRVAKHVKFEDPGHLVQVRYIPKRRKKEPDFVKESKEGGRKGLTFQTFIDLRKQYEGKQYRRVAPADGRLLGNRGEAGAAGKKAKKRASKKKDSQKGSNKRGFKHGGRKGPLPLVAVPSSKH